MTQFTSQGEDTEQITYLEISFSEDAKMPLKDLHGCVSVPQKPSDILSSVF